MAKSTLSQWDEQALWEIYRRHDGNISACADGADGPTSRNTWKKFIIEFGFEDRLLREKEQIAQIVTKHYGPERLQNLEDQLDTMQRALFDLLVPGTKVNDDGETVWDWRLKPTKFEAAARILLQIVDKLQVLRGGVANRTEIRTVIDINLKTYHKEVAHVLLELASEGVIPQSSAREVLHRVQTRLESKELVLEPPD